MVAPLNGMQSESWIVRELTRGVTPTNPAFEKVRITGGMPALTKDTIQSEELNSLREITDITTGNVSVPGEFAIEFSHGSHDEIIASAMSSSWVSGFNQAGLTVTVDSVAKTYTRDAGSFIADGVVVGDLVAFNALSGNNLIAFNVTAVTATVITGAGIRHALTDESEPTDYSDGDKVGTGTECGSFSIYTKLTSLCGDATVMFMTTGAEFTGWSLENAISSKVTGSLPFIGSDMTEIQTEPAGATFSETTSLPYDNKQSSVLVDGELIGGVTSITYSNDNNASAQYELNDDGMSFIERGKATNTVSASMFMRDTVLFNKYKNDTDISTSLILSKKTGEAISIHTPALVLTEVTPENSAQSNTQSVAGTAKGSATQSSIIIQRLPLVV